MNTLGKNPFHTTKDLWLVDEKLDLASAMNNVFLTTDTDLVQLALSGLSMALNIRTYDKAHLILLRNVLEAKLEMVLNTERRAEYVALVQPMQEMIKDIEERIIS